MLSATSVPRLEEPPLTKPALRECFGCGQFQLVPALGPDMRSDCVRCGIGLRRTRSDPLKRALALNCTALILFAIVWMAMLLTVSKAGIEHATTLISGPIELVKHGLWPLGLVVFFTTAIAPLGKIVGTLYVLVGLRMSSLPPNLRGVFLFSRKMGIWAMLEVLMLGVFVAYTKLGDLVNIQVGPASRSGPIRCSTPMRCGRRSSGEARPIGRCRKFLLSISTRMPSAARAAGW